MSLERLKNIKETLMCAVEGQIYNLEEVDAEELGEVVDMIKDLEEAIYYCHVVKAMEESEEKKENGGEMMYYTPYYRNGQNNGGGRSQYGQPWSPGEDYYDTGRRYYNGNSSRGSNEGENYGNSSPNGNSNGRGSSQYTEKEFPYAFQDEREGRSPRSRRMYMEAKETKQDKAVQMRELEKYIQELAQDLTEMIEGSSMEERQYLVKKISALATKINQSNG